jgi:serine/threonine-protein kinase RsbW
VISVARPRRDMTSRAASSNLVVCGRFGPGRRLTRTVTESASTISLELDSNPQSVALARGMLSAVLELLKCGPELLDDVKMAVSEACNNVVLHAYPDRVGPLCVDLELPAGTLVVVVRDRGIGLSTGAPAKGRLGVGLPMMETLADDAQFVEASGGGTEVRLRFGVDSQGPQGMEPDQHSERAGHAVPTAPSGRPRTEPARVRPAAEPAPLKPAEPARVRPAGEVVVSDCPTALVGGVMGRLATIISAAARFSLDRLSDVRLFTDAVAARLQTTRAGSVTFALATQPRRLEVAVGPLEPATAGRLVPERSSLSASTLPLLLADTWAREPFYGAELVRAVITDPGAPGPPADWVATS